MQTPDLDTLDEEREGMPAPGSRSTTTKYDFMVVSNRLPVDRVPEGDGPGESEDGWRRSPGGLVTALAPMMTRTDGAWVGWHGAPDETLDPFSHDGIDLSPYACPQASTAIAVESSLMIDTN